MRPNKIITAGLTVAVVVSAVAITATGGRQETSQPQQPTYTPDVIVSTYTPSPTETPTPEPTEAYFRDEVDAYPESYYYPVAPYTDSEIDMLSRTVWGEARGCSQDEQRLVVWTVLQRVDDDRFPDTIEDVIMEPLQFAGYSEEHPVENDIWNLCAEVLADWWHGAEPPTLEPYAMTLPYLFFDGDGRHNWYREEWQK